MTERRCAACRTGLPALGAVEAYEAAQEPVEHPDLCQKCEGTPGAARHVMVDRRCVFCGQDDHSIGNTPDCPARGPDDPPLLFSAAPGSRWVIRTETGSRHLVDIETRTVTRLPANTGGEPLDLVPWSDRTHRADGRLRADEQPVPLAGLPKPWPPKVGEPMQMILELVPGQLTVRTTSWVTDVITLDG